ncbi:MAG: hypothetical protein L7U87_05245 [Chlamydiales bacterium]|nr:hypothetical protein [Chlamydiales bacterium]
MKKNILFISYNFPPTGWSGVQRTVKFIKYLNKDLYNPIVLTVPRPSYSFRDSVTDSTLLEELPNNLEVIRAEEVRLDHLLIDSFKEIEACSFDCIEQMVDRSLDSFIAFKEAVFQQYKKAAQACFQPDSYLFWVKPALEAVKDWSNEKSIDLVISSGPPHSSHLIGAYIKRDLGVPWIADFRDPWLCNPVIEQNSSLSFTKDIEKNLINQCDRAIFATPKTLKMYQESYPRYKEKLTLLCNGYDEEDFSKLRVNQSKTFTIAHLGTIYPAFIPAVKCFLKGLRRYIEGNREQSLKVVFKGWNYPEAEQAIKDMVDILGLQENVFIESYVEHKRSLEELCNADISLLFIGFEQKMVSVIPGKTFEYARSGTPCLIFAPKKSDAAAIFKKESSYYLISEEDEIEVSKALSSLNPKLTPGLNDRSSLSVLYKNFERSELTRQLETHIHDVLKAKVAYI